MRSCFALAVMLFGFTSQAHAVEGPDKPSDGASLIVTRDAISFSALRQPDWSKLWPRRRGYRVMRLTNGFIGSAQTRPMKIAALIDRLRRVQAQRARTHKKPDFSINMMTSSDVPARTVAHILYALGQAEFGAVVHLTPNELKSPTGLTIVFPSVRTSPCLQEGQEPLESRAPLGVLLNWSSKAIEVSVEGVHRCVKTLHTANDGARAEPCGLTPLRLDGACPAVALPQQRLARKRIKALAQRVCSGGRLSRWRAPLRIDLPFNDLLGAAIQIFAICQQRIEWTLAPKPDPDHCARAQSFDQLEHRFQSNRCSSADQKEPTEPSVRLRD